MQKVSHSVRTIMTGIAMLLSIAAVSIALAAWFRPPPAPPSSDYDRIVAELWELVQPVYEDFEIRTPAERPATLTEALDPLLRLQQSVAE